MSIIIVTPPTVEPLTSDEVTGFLHADLSEGTLIDSLIAANREWAETATGLALCPQTRELLLDKWPCGSDAIVIHCAPIPSIASIIYKDSSGNPTTWGSTQYIADLDSIPARILPASGQSWPSGSLLPLSPIRVRFACGDSTVPDGIKQTMLRRIRWQFDHRDPADDQIAVRGGQHVIPEAIEQALQHELWPYRVWQF